MNSTKPKVLVSGCFDVLHSGHVEFLQRASEIGELYVSVGSDATVMQLKGRRPVIPEEERAFIVRSIKGVHSAFVASGVLPIDFAPDMKRIKPNVLIVNSDGVSQAKRDLCARLGTEIRVLEREPAAGLTPLSTTSLRSADLLPYRVELCGGWSDLPDNSAMAGGAVVTVSLEPNFEYAAGGMAGSTRKKAAQLWGGILPGGDPVQQAHQLFCCDNPPGTAMVSGPQDSIGICVPGACLLEYSGQWWPHQISRDDSEETARFIEQHVRLMRLPKRTLDYNPLSITRYHEAGVKRLSDAARSCWQAIQTRNAELLAHSFNECRKAQDEMMPLMFKPVEPEINQILASCGNVKLSGAGGGGLAVFVSTEEHPDWIIPRVRF